MMTLRQSEIDWLISNGVPLQAIINPSMILLAFGRRARDGIFEPRIGDDAESGEVNGAWFGFQEPDDDVFWQPRTGSLATDRNSAFSLGEDLIDSAGPCAIGGHLRIFSDPLRWLQHSRQGIVVLDWAAAFDRLRDVSRIAVDEALLPTYRRWMKPRRMPELSVIPTETRRAAA